MEFHGPPFVSVNLHGTSPWPLKPLLEATRGRTVSLHGTSPWPRQLGVKIVRLLPDAELGEDHIQEIVGDNFADDFAELVEGLPQVKSDELEAGVGLR